MNLFLPRIDHDRKRAVYVMRYPGETLCAQIMSRPMAELRLNDLCDVESSAPAFEQIDRKTGLRKAINEACLRAAVAMYYDRPGSIAAFLRGGWGECVRTPDFEYRAMANLTEATTDAEKAR
jgi:hypothetical protein